MKIPIYKEFRLPEKCINRALYFEKFCNQWDDRQDWTFDKKPFLVAFANQLAGNAESIENALNRYCTLIEKLEGQIVFVRTQGRFVTGMGNEHPIENGFLWHPTLAAPYLPGSSLKGLLRSWFALNGLESQEIFGNESQKKSGQVGRVIFFDAIPRKPVELTPDVMTPHYPEYYSKEKVPPGDWQQPVPIPFLAVDNYQAFVFAFAPRRKEDSKFIPQVYDNLKKVLSVFGAGAKRAVGYGRFTEDLSATNEYERQKKTAEKKRQRMAKVTPVQREMLKDGYDSDGFINRIESWLERADRAAGEEKVEIAEALRDWYNSYRKGTYEKPNKKNIERVRRIKEILNS